MDSDRILRRGNRSHGINFAALIILDGRFRAERLNAHRFLTFADTAETFEAWPRYDHEERLKILPLGGEMLGNGSQTQGPSLGLSDEQEAGHSSLPARSLRPSF